MARRHAKNQTVKLKHAEYVIVGIFLVFLLFFLYNKTIFFFENAPLFQIREVVQDPSVPFMQSSTLDRLVGQNIFKVDLKSIQKRLQGQHEEINDIRLWRQFPNRIIVVTKKREPCAMVSWQDRQILLDKEGAVLSYPSGAPGSWPEIRVSPQGKKFEWGKKMNFKDIDIAFQILRAIENSQELKPYALQLIDAQNLSKIEVHLTNHLKVFLDRDKIDYKIQTLGLLLSQGRLNLDEIEYIDLRFKEPILGKK